ncbi:hypothetical protein RCH16_002643 [Cryobacterium sp. MP_M5]|uniref:DUF4097 family beta strand repeat-containing protein n=1 Tax=unclassified Cryobacterium TaxID=2649013 RepID=UPI0018C92E7E|nr:MULTISPECIES: DUF4097 family beta strand repeat-containing protein [unclassified Cryobacterium]MBG6059398.1 hypothetical protein [Cryobacterium sp. MP_M3]MEC5177623.1 hypothetical protein [Cryobacterium sp. MP_M5]
MPTYRTPTPIDLAINLQVGEIEVVAGDRADTVVTVSPTNPARSVDRRGAEETLVTFDGERLTITGPKPRFSIIGPTESVDLKVELPAGSRLTAEIAVGNARTAGRLGATRIKNLTGSVEVDTTGDLWLRAGHGNATVGTIHGGSEITADHGQIRIGTISGDAVLRASHGSITIGESGGALDLKLSYGDLEITRALASVTAKTAYGSIHLGAVSAGAIEVESGYGPVTVGVRPGVPAWLDLASKDGHVRNELDGDRAPDPSEQTVAVRARTQWGGIRIQRAR